MLLKEPIIISPLKFKMANGRILKSFWLYFFVFLFVNFVLTTSGGFHIVSDTLVYNMSFAAVLSCDR